MSESKKQNWRHDPEYISYCSRGESAAVFVVRDVAREQVNTRGKWVDCLALDARQRSDDRWLFKYIVVELFPRKLTPEYDTKDSAHNKYLTWKTAHEDIDQQRTAGGKGPIYYVRCRLVDKNANNFESVEKWWDRECDCWIADPALVRPEFCEKRMYKYPIKPEWVYVITEAREITREQAQKYIVAQTKDNYGYGSW